MWIVRIALGRPYTFIVLGLLILILVPDQYVSDLASKRSALDSAKANLQRLEQLQSFEKVTAPFAGVITARSTDIGALIDAGAATSPKELFRISDVSLLCIYAAVPEVDLASARDGAEVKR
jgi:multidrug resistance efflux pump